MVPPVSPQFSVCCASSIDSVSLDSVQGLCIEAACDLHVVYRCLEDMETIGNRGHRPFFACGGAPVGVDECDDFRVTCWHRTLLVGGDMRPGRAVPSTWVPLVYRRLSVSRSRKPSQASDRDHRLHRPTHAVAPSQSCQAHRPSRPPTLRLAPPILQPARGGPSEHPQSLQRSAKWFQPSLTSRELAATAEDTHTNPLPPDAWVFADARLLAAPKTCPPED